MPLSVNDTSPNRIPLRVPQEPREAGSLLGPAVGHFALEVAARLEPIARVLARYGLTGDQYRALLKQEPFREAVREASVRFASLGGTGERIKLKTQLLIELSLDEMWSIIGDSRQSASARVAAFSAIKSLTGLEKPEAAPAAQKFQLTIALPPNMGAKSSYDDVPGMTGATPLTIEGEAA